MLNLDTHILIYALEDSLKPNERRLLQQDSWTISAIVLWEIAKLHQLGRIAIGLDAPDLQRTLRTTHIWPLDWAVCRQSARLDFNSDPADELIAATSIVHGIPLLTRDRQMRKSKQLPLAR